MSGQNPQGASGRNPQGASGKNPQGASGKNPQGASGRNPQGASGKNPQGASGRNPQGASGLSVNVNNSDVQIGMHNVRNVVNVPQPKKVKVKPPKKPLTNSVQEPSRDQMDHISKEIKKYKATAWKELGERLGLSQGELETVEHDFHREGIPEVCYQMIRRWKERSPTPPQVKILAQALCDIGRGDLSDYLASA